MMKASSSLHLFPQFSPPALLLTARGEVGGGKRVPPILPLSSFPAASLRTSAPSRQRRRRRRLPFALSNLSRSPTADRGKEGAALPRRGCINANTPSSSKSSPGEKKKHRPPFQNTHTSAFVVLDRLFLPHPNSSLGTFRPLTRRSSSLFLERLVAALKDGGGGGAEGGLPPLRFGGGGGLALGR